MLTGKWTPINREVGRFNSLVNETKVLSRENDDDRMTRVEILYKSVADSDFKHKCVWLFLKDKHKWKNPDSTNARRNRGRVTEEEPEFFGDDEFPRTAGNQRVVASGASCDGTPKASNSSPLVSPTATINMPRGLYNVDVAATFRVPLTAVGDLDVLKKDIEAGKHEELVSGMTNDERKAVMDTLVAMCHSILAENTNASAIPCKVSYVDDSTIVDALVAENFNVDESPCNTLKIYRCRMVTGGITS
ncbi:hypothetical protein Tco_0025837 [Tanacetum coccineum]